MLPTLIAISGMLAAEAPARADATVAAVEIAFVTHAGEGAAGRKRFTRDGCYQVASGGSTGGAGYAHDSQAGCHRPTDVAEVFGRLDAIGADRLVREGAAVPAAAHAAPDRRRGPGGSEETVVLVRRDGTRWVAANQATADDVLRAVNELPSENQSGASSPEKQLGTGAQLLALSAAGGRRSGRLEGFLASDGRWWCYTSIIGPRGGEDRLPAKKASAATNAPARLGRILAGAHADAPESAPRDDGSQVEGTETNIQIVWPGKEPALLRPSRLAPAVVERFVAEMKPLSPACAGR
jgi:hypothetical protein